MAAFRTYIALIVFLGSYFVFTVFGNLLYFTDLGDMIGRRGIASFSIDNFTHAGSAGYWVLLFLPFVMAPPIAIIVRHAAAPLATLPAIPPIPKSAYAVLVAALYTYAAVSLWNADALHLLLRPQNLTSVLDNRFLLLALLGFWPQVAIKSVLFALSVYGLIEALMQRDRFWKIATAFNQIAMLSILVLLNMRWPVVIFYLAHLAAIGLFAKRPIVPAALFGAMALASYFLISLLVLRVTVEPTAPPAAQITQTAPVVPDKAPSAEPQAVPIAPRQVPSAEPTARRESPLSGLILSANSLINRMAQPFPFYFEIFSNSPNKCGSLLGRILRQPSPCQPSNFVYATMFSDRFSGEGTAPQPPHVTGFAIDGWSGVLIELTLTSIILGLFAAAFGANGAVQATISVMGAVTGYFYSQLPFEGPIIYDHGVFWWGAPLFLYALFRRMQPG